MKPNDEVVNKIVKKYLVNDDNRLNFLFNLTPELYRKALRKGIDLKMSSIEIENSIGEFVELYGDLYQTTKEGIDDMPKILMRGTDYSELDELEEDLTDFTLATTNEKIAERYAENGVIINFILDAEVPYIDLSNCADERARAGILISPFCHVEKFAKLANNRYVIKLKKTELEDFADEEIVDLKARVVSGYSQQMNNFVEYEELASTISNWQNRFSKANNELDQRYIGNKLVEFTKEKDKILSKIESYNNDCANLLIGLCKRKEEVVDNYLKAEIARREAEY